MHANTFKFSITNLILVNQVYPYDFFLRVKTLDQYQEVQESPIIRANQSECQEVFPWEFIVSDVQLQIEFIQTSQLRNNNKAEIIRSSVIIEDLTDQNQQTVAFTSDKDNKQLCIISYKLQECQDQFFADSQDAKPKRKITNKNKNKQQVENLQNQPQMQTKIVYTRKQHQQLSRQISKINKSIGKILQKQKNQHAVFNRYLDQSTNFIRQMVNHSKQKPSNMNNKNLNRTNNMSSYLGTDNSKIEQQPQNQELDQFDNQNNSEVKYSEGKNQSSRDQDILAEQSLINKKWYINKFRKRKPLLSKNYPTMKQIQSKKPQIIIVQQMEFKLDDPSTIFYQIQFHTQMKPNQVIFSFYRQNIMQADQNTIKNGNEQPSQKKQAVVRMKTTWIDGTRNWDKVIQLPLIHKQSEAIIVTAIDDNKCQLQGCVSLKEIQNLKAILYNDIGKQNGFVSFKCKINNNFSVQTQQIINNDQSEIKSTCNQSVKSDSHVEAGSVLPNQKQNKLNQTEKSQHKEDPQKNAFVESVTNLKRPIRSKHSNKKQNSIQKQQMENKQASKSPIYSRCDIVSNSVQIQHMPFIKKKQPQAVSQQQLNTSKFSEKIGLNAKNKSIKVDSVSIKLCQQNNNQFVGKFLKISSRNKNPYVTQSISLSNNLLWSGKGYIFQNISPYGQIKIQLCFQQNNKMQVIGTSKICLALLNLQKQNSTQFYHQYLRDEKQQKVGQLILGYDAIRKMKKITKSQRYSDGICDQSANQMIQIKINKKRKKGQRLKQKELKTFSQEHTNRTQKKGSRAIGLQTTQAKSIIGSSNVIRSKKYTGGNIIIGRAPRFKTRYNTQIPGPGDYQMPSTFQRHAAIQ